MKSTQEHLSSTKSFGEVQNINYRPTMRSSAVFPVIHKPGKIISIYTFMGYWLRKRNIPLVTALVTLRNESGEKINVKSIEINQTKSYEILSSDIITDQHEDFDGSVEIEIFSAVDMVFPYPAITFALKGVNGLTFVHTCGRIYNDFDDLKSNTEQAVAETGFDLLVGKDYAPFFSFVNGPVPIKNKEIKLEYITQTDERIHKKLNLKEVKPYGLGWVNLDLGSDTKLSNGSTKICVKVSHDFKGFFPRFVAGNVFRDFEDISITHSYYDTSTDKTDSAIWNNPSISEFEDGFASIPFDTDFSKIELAIYPNSALTKTPINLNFELYDIDGEFVSNANSKIEIGSTSDKLSYINLLSLFEDYRTSIPKGMVKFIMNGAGSVPARMKFGLNFCKPSAQKNLPSNICFNAELPNEKMLKKPGTFRWCPILDARAQKVYLHNTSFVKKGYKEAQVEVEVWRSKDNQKFKWNITIPYNGTKEVLVDHRDAITDFLDGSVGWVGFSCSSPFIFGYYITDYNEGVVGADHLY